MNDLTSSVSELSSSLSELGTGFWAEMVAAHTDEVNWFLTGGYGGSDTAGYSWDYIERTRAYAAYGNDYTAAAQRVVQYTNEMAVLQAQIAANQNTRSLVEKYINGTLTEYKGLDWSRRLMGMQISNVASTVHSTVATICQSIAYQAAEIYTSCMAEETSSGKTIQSFCGRFDAESSHYIPFKALILAPTDGSTDRDVMLDRNVVTDYLTEYYQMFADYSDMTDLLYQQLFKPERSTTFLATMKLNVLKQPDLSAIPNATYGQQYARCKLEKALDLSFTECPTSSLQRPASPLQTCYISKEAYDLLPADDDPCETALLVNGSLRRTALFNDGDACCIFPGYSTGLSDQNRSHVMNGIGSPTGGVYVSNAAFDAFKDTDGDSFGRLNFTISSTSFSERDQSVLKHLTSTFVTGYMVYIHAANQGTTQPIKAMLRPVSGSVMVQNICLPGGSSGEGCTRASLQFGSGSGTSSLNANPFGSFSYTNPDQLSVDRCGFDKLAPVFNEEHAALCGPHAKFDPREVEQICEDADGPVFCIPDQMTGEHFLDYFLPADQESKFWKGSSSALLPSLYTDWQLELLEGVDLTLVTKDDLFITLSVQAVNSYELDRPVCSFDDDTNGFLSSHASARSEAVAGAGELSSGILQTIRRRLIDNLLWTFGSAPQ